MRAALLTEAGKPLEIVDDVEIRDPRAGEVLVRVKNCGICHSDLSVVDGAFPAATPIVLGHEAPRVVAAGLLDQRPPGVVVLALREVLDLPEREEHLPRTHSVPRFFQSWITRRNLPKTIDRARRWVDSGGSWRP